VDSTNYSPYLHRGRAKHHLGNIEGSKKDFAFYNQKKDAKRKTLH